MAFSSQRLIVAWIPAEDGYAMTSAFMVYLVGAAEAFRGGYESSVNPFRIFFVRTFQLRTMVIFSSYGI